MAAVARTGEVTYTLRTVDDFLAVPPDRLDACLKAFAVVLEALRDVRGVIPTKVGQEPVCYSLGTLSGWTWTDEEVGQPPGPGPERMG